MRSRTARLTRPQLALQTLLVCGLEALLLTVLLLVGLYCLGPIYVRPWWLPFSCVVAAVCAAEAVARWRRGRLLTGNVALTYGLVLLAAPQILRGSVWYDGRKLSAGMTTQEVLETMAEHWLYHWSSDRGGPDATRVSEYLEQAGMPPWSDGLGSRRWVFTDFPPSADTVETEFGADGRLTAYSFGVD